MARIKVAYVRELERKVSRGEITLSRMVELLNEKADQKEDGFVIDFFEFAFLVEACIPPAPIARSVFFDKVCDEYYHQMTPEQRKRLFDWITKNRRFDITNEDYVNFYNRFNLNNQYLIEAKNGKEEEIIEAYRHKGEYHISKNSWIQSEYITKIEKINHE